MTSSGNGGNDFRSLLSTFQEATSSGRVGTNSSSTTSSSSTTTTPKSLKEKTERLYRISQIRQANKNSNITSSSSSQAAESITTTAMSKSPTTENSTAQDVHIAICAVVVDEFPHEDIWRKWIEKTGGKINVGGSSSNSITASAELYVHAKYPDRIRSSWLRTKTLPFSHKPNWNDVRVIRAMLSLAEKALEEESSSSSSTTTTTTTPHTTTTTTTTHVLYCTESCLPITSLADLSRHLASHPQKSFFNAYAGNDLRCTRFDERECWSPLSIHVPSCAIRKVLPGWVLLHASHVRQIIGLDFDLTPAFENVWAPEEVYFPTVMCLLGLLGDDDDENVMRESLMWAEWDERARGKERAHPLVYDGMFGKELVERVTRGGYFFMRKFKKRIRTGFWGEVVLGEMMKKKEDSKSNRWEERDSSSKRDCRHWEGRSSSRGERWDERNNRDRRWEESRGRDGFDNRKRRRYDDRGGGEQQRSSHYRSRKR